MLIYVFQRRSESRFYCGNCRTVHKFGKERDGSILVSLWRVAFVLKFTKIITYGEGVLLMKCLFLHQESYLLAHPQQSWCKIFIVKLRLVSQWTWAIIHGPTVAFVNRDQYQPSRNEAHLLLLLEWWRAVVMTATMTAAHSILMVNFIAADIELIRRRSQAERLWIDYLPSGVSVEAQTYTNIHQNWRD